MAGHTYNKECGTARAPPSAPDPLGWAGHSSTRTPPNLLTNAPAIGAYLHSHSQYPGRPESCRHQPGDTRANIDPTCPKVAERATAERSLISSDTSFMNAKYQRGDITQH